MRIIENSKTSKKLELKEFNNLENKITEFFNFICELCRKYDMKIYKVVKTHTFDKNMGVQLISINGGVNIFYNSDKKILEFEVKGKYIMDIEKDIVTYASMNKFNKNDKVIDCFGKTYMVNEPVTITDVSRKVTLTNLKDNKTYDIYTSLIVPSIE